MKKLATICFVLLAAGVCFQTAFSQLLVENFVYQTGTLLTANGWSAHSGAGTNSPAVISPALTYPNYPGSGSGNAAQLVNTGEDVNRQFAALKTGSLFASFLVKVDSAQTPGDYFFHFFQSSSIFKARVFARKAKRMAAPPRVSSGKPDAQGDIPTGSVHAVNLRDQGRCGHIGEDGVRCTERRWLHFHHVIPRSKGGAHQPDNLITLCSAHHRMQHPENRSVYSGHAGPALRNRSSA